VDSGCFDGAVDAVRDEIDRDHFAQFLRSRFFKSFLVRFQLIYYGA
jgi:hypothetical protein